MFVSTELRLIGSDCLKMAMIIARMVLTAGGYVLGNMLLPGMDGAIGGFGGSKLHVSKIAWVLGFAEVSAFTHVCKRWTGKTPSQMRTAGAY